MKLLDFGLARHPDNDTLTTPGRVMGTAAYMAPEQAKGAEVDSRADLFSFGAVLYELCSGVSPFARPHYINSLVAVTDHHPESLDRAHPWLPADLVALVTDLLAKDPAARVQTAGEVAARLQQIEEAAKGPGLLGGAVGAPSAEFEVVPMAEPVETVALAGSIDAVARPAPARRAGRRWVWAGLAAGVLAPAGIVYGLSGNGQQKEDPNKPKAETPKPDEKKPVVIAPGLLAAPVAAGEPISARAMTKTPAKYFADGTWTMETTVARKPVNAIAYQPGGTLIAVGSEDGTIRLYEAATGKFHKALVTKGECRDLAWTPDGKCLVVLEVTRQLTTIRDIETGKVIREIDAHLSDPSVSPDGSQLAGISAESGVLVYDLTKVGKPLQLTLPKTIVGAFAWHPKSTQLMLGYNDGQVRLWDTTKQKPDVVREFDTRVGQVGSIAWHSDRRYAIVGEGEYAIWLEGKRVTGRSYSGWPTSSWSLKGDALLICSGVGDEGIVIDTTNAEGKTRQLDSKARKGSWSPDGKQIAILERERSRIVDRNGKVLLTIPMFDRDLVYNAQKGYFVPAQKGENPFVFVVQTKDGQKTYTPDEFEKVTKGEKGDKPGWKNDPDSLK